MRIVLTDDHQIVREGLRWMLDSEPDVEIVAEAESGERLLELLETIEADIVLLDVKMPGMSGIETLEAIREQRLDLPVLMLTMYDDSELVQHAIRLGVDGYVPKSATREELLEAIRRTANGGYYLHGDLMEAVVKAHVDGSDHHQFELAPREIEALQHVADGHSNREIAELMGTTEHDVKTCLHHVFDALDARSRSQAVAIGIRLGLIE